jgi:hypothetical protein
LPGKNTSLFGLVVSNKGNKFYTISTRMTTFFSADFEEIATDEIPTNDAFRSSNTFWQKVIKVRLRKRPFSTARRNRRRKKSRRKRI